MPPFVEGGAYCFAHVGLYVGWAVARSPNKMIPNVIHVSRSKAKIKGNVNLPHIVQLITQ